MKRIFNWLKGLLIILAPIYGIIFWLSLPPEIPKREFPWWEDYAGYYQGDWRRLIDQLYHQGYQPAKGVNCAEIAQAKRWSLKTTSIHFCFDDSGKYSRYVWKRYGLFGVLTGYKSWSAPDYNLSDGINHGLQYWFPHGPYSLLTPYDAREAQKQVIEKPLTDAEIVDAFLEIVTVEERTKFNPRRTNQPINKYEGSVNLVADDFSNNAIIAGKPVLQWVDAFLAELRELTGLTITRLAKRNGEENMTLVLLKKSQREEVLSYAKNLLDQSDANTFSGYYPDMNRLRMLIYRDDSDCFGRMGFDPKQFFITETGVFIFLDEEQRVPGCIQEEIAQSLGVNNDVRELEPTMFNDYSPYRSLTELDKVLLRILYDPHIKAGMQSDEARPIAETIVKGLREKGQLSHIKKRVYAL